MPPHRGQERLSPQSASPEALRRTWVAARLNGIRAQDVPEWAEQHDLPTTSSSGFERAVGPVRAAEPRKGQRGRPGDRRTKERPLLRDWLLVDEPALGVRKMLYRLPNDGMPQQRLLDELSRLTGVRQVIEASSDRELLIIGLVRTEQEARLLRGRIEDLAPGRSVKMDVVESEDWRAARRTWMHVAASD